MNPWSGAARHLEIGQVLDYLEGRLSARALIAVERHLATPCRRCRERLVAAAQLVERMQSDRSVPVPELLHRIALESFGAVGELRSPGQSISWLARLVFDSATSPSPAFARHAIGEARRLRFELGGDTLECEFEPEGAGLVTLRGCLKAPDALLHTLELATGEERRVAHPAGDGLFAIVAVPAGPLEITLAGPDGTWRLPVIEI
ncbi:MAG: hypothetical protein HOP12_05735 [Candidatus Eisenbacteria bacterium]|uniref:Zinc-finger domain-containing protein n=1 Tax=Eiseniibacteriota bacterium TaxID=2212470 RepID=A0A849SLE1_UNCEI|nr:hypothetical protein [Candidatus Eisenbacteria bacterium]